MMLRVIKREIGCTLIVVSILAIFTACPRRSEHPASSATTQTVAPAAAQPAPTGTDALTQTVDVEDSRSEEEGGTATAATTTVAKTPAKKPAPKTKKH